MKKLIFFGLIIFGLILPFFALAGNLSGPLVPCGRDLNGNGVLDQGEQCTLCDIFVMIQHVIDFITAGLFVIAGIFVAVGGVRMLASAGSPEHVEAGKKMITYAITGIVIALLSWVILNMLFLGLFGEQKGFQGPWNEIECVGGGIVESGVCTCGDNKTVSSRTYTTGAECTANCSSYCDKNYKVAGCCDTVIKQNGCFASPPAGQWCQRPAPSGSDKWILNPPPGGANSRQKGDATSSLAEFINCMYSRLPNLRINSISENYLCDNPSCDVTKLQCGSHGINSCHYGGKKCAGASSAVDFDTTVKCSDIYTAAHLCNSTAWVNWETNHTHVSINNASCDCAEYYFTARPCP